MEPPSQAKQLGTDRRTIDRDDVEACLCYADRVHEALGSTTTMLSSSCWKCASFMKSK